MDVTVECDRVIGPHDRPRVVLILWIYRASALICVVSLFCPQTYIFTDGEDEELKKKIGEFHEGGFASGNREAL